MPVKFSQWGVAVDSVDAQSSKIFQSGIPKIARKTIIVSVAASFFLMTGFPLSVLLKC